MVLDVTMVKHIIYEENIIEYVQFNKYNKK
jgi:hypothetical protein